MKLNSLEVLSKRDIGLIHENSLKILGNIGIKVDSIEIIEILRSNGCLVDDSSMIVRFPEKVINRCLGSLPEKVRLIDRNGRTAVMLGDGGRYCASGHNAVFTMIDETGARREAKLKDVEQFAILSEHLRDVDVAGIPYSPQDVPAKTALLYSLRTMIENTIKPVFYSCESGMINEAALEMSRTLIGKRDLREGSYLISQLSTTSPLYWEKGAAEALFVCSKAGMPVDFLPQPITGVTAPYTLAGILTMHNAEVLSGIVIAQLINPGTPLVYGAAWTTYEMKLTNVLIGRPESSLLRIAGAQMAHHYRMPSHTTAPDNDSNLHDEQGAWEKMLSTIAGIIGANDMIVNLGMFGTGMSISLEQLVMDSEICRIVKRFHKGFEVNEDTIAFDTIENVGIRGVFFTEDNTLQNLRSGEHVELDVSNGANYDVWSSKGSKSSSERAGDIAAEIISKGNRCPVDKKLSDALAGIIKKYE